MGFLCEDPAVRTPVVITGGASNGTAERVDSTQLIAGVSFPYCF